LDENKVLNMKVLSEILDPQRIHFIVVKNRESKRKVFNWCTNWKL